jgi:serine/threonine-protein kinase
MIRLHTFGSVELTGDDGSEVRAILAQPKRLALLTFLAVAGKGGFQRRDTVLAAFWPERDADQARAALNRAIYYLRQSLGDGVVVSRGDEEIGLAASRFWCDAVEFERVATDGDHRHVVDLFQGDFLDGFFVSDASGFEAWVEAYRGHARAAACKAGWSLADAAGVAGARADAVTWGRWAAERSPLDEAGIQRLVRLLDRAGDRAGAMLVYDDFARRLARDLELSPSPETDALVASIRARDLMPPTRTGGAAPADDSTPLDLGSTDHGEPGRDRGNSRRLAAITPSRRRGLRAMLGAIVIGAVATLGLLVAVRPSAVAFEDRGWVLIGNFDNSTGDRSFDRTLDLALATALRQSTRINVVPQSDIKATLQRMRRPPSDSQLTEAIAVEVARRDGIAVVVLGRIATVGSTYHLTLRAIDAATGREQRARQATAGAKNDVIATLDRLSARLREDLGESATAIKKGTPLPKATTESIEALEKYAAGLRAMDAALYAEAAVLLRAAIQLDTSFAMAYGALGQVFYGAQRRADGDMYFDRALAVAERLTDRERALIQIQAAGSRGSRLEAMRLLRALLTQYPDDQRAWTQLGYEAFRSGSLREALAAYETAARIRPLRASDWTNVASTYSVLGVNDSALVAYGRAFALDPDLETWAYNNNQYGKALVFAGRFEAARATFEKMLSRSAVDRVRGLRSLAYLDFYRGNYQAGIAHMSEATLIAGGFDEQIIEPRTRMMLASALEESGQHDAGRRERMRVVRSISNKNFPPRLLLFLGKPLARGGNIRLASEILDSLRARARADNPEDQSDLAVLEGEVALARGRTGQATDYLRRAFGLDSTKYALESLAHATMASGDLSTSTKLYERLASGHEFGWEPQQYWRFAPYWLGVVYEARGDRRLALEAYHRLLREWPGADSTLPVIKAAKRRLERLESLE